MTDSRPTRPVVSSTDSTLLHGPPGWRMALQKPRRRTQTEIAPAPTATFMPAKFSLPALRESAAHCRGCPLYLNATQTVFGEGAARASIVLVGEQPGDQEDLQGRPF